MHENVRCLDWGVACVSFHVCQKAETWQQHVCQRNTSHANIQQSTLSQVATGALSVSVQSCKRFLYAALTPQHSKITVTAVLLASCSWQQRMQQAKLHTNPHHHYLTQPWLMRPCSDAAFRATAWHKCRQACLRRWLWPKHLWHP